MKSPNITHVEMDFSALFERNGMPIDTGRGYSVEEIVAATGYGSNKVRKALRKAMDEGLVSYGKKSFTDLSGRVTTKPCYIFEPKQ